MSLPFVLSIRERLVGCWRLVGYSVTADGGEASHPLGTTPLGTIPYTPGGHMSAQLAKPRTYDDDQQPTAYVFASSSPYEVDEQARTVAHRVQVSVILRWLGTSQLRQVQFPELGTLMLTAIERSPRDGGLTTTTITWSRQPSR